MFLVDFSDDLPSVAVIILNWNGWEDTVECLESLYQINYPNYQVILVDNASQDDSIQKIKEYCQGTLKPQSTFYTYNTKNKPIKTTQQTEQEVKLFTGKFKDSQTNQSLILIENFENYGFAGGNNIGIRFALEKLQVDYVLLLNNDTVVDKNFITELVNVSEKEVKIGIVGSKLLNAYNTDVIDSAGHIIKWGRVVDRGHGEIDKSQYDSDDEVAGAMAAAALYKTSMLKEIGILDESFITLGEDAELSLRARKHGWKAKFAPKSVVYHKRGKSITRKDVINSMTILSTKNTTENVLMYATAWEKILYSFILIKEGSFVVIGSLLGRNSMKARDYSKLIINSYKRIILSLFKSV